MPFTSPLDTPKHHLGLMIRWCHTGQVKQGLLAHGRSQSLRQKKEDEGGASEADKPGLGPLLCLFAGLGWLVLFRALVSSLHPHLKEAPSGKNGTHERFLCRQVAPAATPASPVLTETKTLGSWQVYGQHSWQPWEGRRFFPRSVGRCRLSQPDLHRSYLGKKKKKNKQFKIIFYGCIGIKKLDSLFYICIFF